MQRRNLFKMAAAFVVSMFALSTVACSKTSIILWANTAISFLEQTLPKFQTLIPGSVATLTKTLAVAKDLKIALEKDSASAVDFINQLLSPGGLIEQILNDVELIKDEAQRNVVSGILLIASAALMTVYAALEQGAPEAPPALVAQVKSRGISPAVNVSSKLQKALKALKS